MGRRERKRIACSGGEIADGSSPSNGAQNRNQPIAEKPRVAAVETTGAVPGCTTDEPVGGTPPLFRLTVERTDGADANMPVRWCLSKDALAELQRRKVQDPHLLIVVARETGSTELGARLEEVRRLLLPLDRAMDRVIFPRPGKHRVFAMVVWSTKATPPERWSEMHNLILNTDWPNYIKTFVNGEEFTGKTLLSWNILSLDHVAELRVSVDEQFFAKAPSARLAWYVNLWCGGKPCDECQFRNRLLWAFGIKWLPFFIWCMLVEAIRAAYALFLALIGRRQINLGPIWHPFTLKVSDVDGDPDHKLRDSRGYWTQTTPQGEPRRLLFFLATTPLLWVGYALVTWFVWSRWDKLGLHFPFDEGDWKFFLVMCLVYLAVIAGILIAMEFIAVLLFRKARERYMAGEAERIARDLAKSVAAKQAVAERERKALAVYYVERLEPLTCVEGLGERPASVRPKVAVAALPLTHQTVRLRFLELKARVCRPFAL